MQHRKTYSLPAFPSSSFSSRHSPTPSYTSESDAGAGPPPFIELLARSNFSFLQGASHPEELILRAKQLGYRGMAICDVNGLYGIVRGYQAAEKPSVFDAEQLAYTNEDGSATSPFQYLCGSELTPHDASPITLIPMNKRGYTELSRLLTKAKRQAPKGQIAIDFDEILKANENMIAIPLPPWKEDELTRLRDAFQDRVYLPVCRDFTWESVRLYQQALKFENDLGLPLFATGRPLFHDPDRKPLHDVLTCILHKTTLNEANIILSLNRERHPKSLEEIAHLYRERPDLIHRTIEIANRVSFSLSELRYHYPQESLPAGLSASDYLRDLTFKGVEWRYKRKTDPEFRAKVLAQLESELAIIKELEYEDYFLTLWDLCRFARERKILHQGRGSASNSVVCYALGLTSIDPIEFRLLFERFISRERREPPDIDIDFEHERREEVIQYIYEKYGAKHAAMVCTVICYRSRMAIREVAKVMGIPLAQVDQIVKAMGREGLQWLVQSSVAPESSGEAGHVTDVAAPLDFTKLGISEAKFRKLLSLATEMQGFPRHVGIHSGGFVISHEPVVDIVPVENATMEGRYVIQWNKDDINTLGLMKIDVLALGMLTALQKTFALVTKHRGRKFDLANIPHNDKPTYQMIQKADTVGVFQIESRAQMSLLPRLKPDRFYHLVISVAIVRPGPIQGGLVHPFLKRKSGRERVTYAHPSLIPILEKTYGIPLFQEQVMQIAVKAAGFTPGESDELRRIVSSAWKKPHIMEGLRQRVVSGMLSNGISLEYAEQIYRTIEGFSSYGFPESHAASFALLTYASCYLKQHHQDAFACALLNSQPMGFYSSRQLIGDAQRRGVKFLHLDIQYSEWDFTLEGDPDAGLLAVRAGFRSVYGLREDHVRMLENARAEGEFRDLEDLVKRTKLSRVCLVRIGAAGGLRSLGLDPREAIWMLQGMSFDEDSLFFGSMQGLDERRTLAEAHVIPSENEWEEVQREYQTKGFSIDTHPLGVLRPILNATARATARATGRRYSTARDLETMRDRTPVLVAGLKSLIQKPPTAKGMCFVSLEDETGLLNVIITPDLYEKCRLILFNSVLLEVVGVLESREGVRNVKVRELRPLDHEALRGLAAPRKLPKSTLNGFGELD